MTQFPVLNLRWHDVGDTPINLPDSKTGPRSVLLGKGVRAIIDTLPGTRHPDACLFSKHAQQRSAHDIAVCWRPVCEDAKLSQVRLHDLRHTAASHAVMSRENLLLVGKLLGHRRHPTAARYTHLSVAHLVEAAAKVGSFIARAMEEFVGIPK